MPDNSTVLDIEKALSRVRGKQSILKRMLALFLQSGEFEEFEKALAGQDYARASDVAHAIKGLTGNLSMDALAEYSAELMQQLRSGPPEEQLLQAYREALIETRQVVSETMPSLTD